MTAEQTRANRRAAPEPGNDTRLVSIDVAAGTSSELPAGAGVKINPSPLPGNDIGYIRKDTAGSGAGLYYTSGKRGPKGDVRAASWSPDGSRVVFHKRLSAPPTTWRRTFSRNPDYDLTLTSILPSFNPAGDRFVTIGRPSGTVGVVAAGGAVCAPRPADAVCICHDNTHHCVGPLWFPASAIAHLGNGTFQPFL